MDGLSSFNEWAFTIPGDPSFQHNTTIHTATHPLLHQCDHQEPLYSLASFLLGGIVLVVMVVMVVLLFDWGLEISNLE